MIPKVGSLLVLCVCECGAAYARKNLPTYCTACGGFLALTTPITTKVTAIGEQPALRLGL